MIRCFIAIDLSAELKEMISQAQDLLKKSGANVKWVKPSNIHLTLKFLGEIPEKKVEEVKEVLGTLSFEKTEVSVKSLGAFPNMKRPRVIWAGVEKGAEELKKISTVLEERLYTIGFKREKRSFKPHLTIGRVRKPGKIKELMDAVDFLKEFDAGVFIADEIIFMQSELKPGGAVYTPMAKYNMK